MDRRQKEGHIHIAICDLRIRNQRNCIGDQTEGVGTATTISDCDIASEGVQSDRGNANEIGGGFLKSEEGLLDQKKVFMHRKGSLMHRKGSNCIGRGFLLSCK